MWLTFASNQLIKTQKSNTPLINNKKKEALKLCWFNGLRKRERDASCEGKKL